MFLTKLAFKNLARHRNRTLITAIIIALAIFFYILMDSLVGGITEMYYQTLIDYEAGHLQVVNEVYWRRGEFPSKICFHDTEIIAAIEKTRISASSRN